MPHVYLLTILYFFILYNFGTRYINIKQRSTGSHIIIIKPQSSHCQSIHTDNLQGYAYGYTFV